MENSQIPMPRTCVSAEKHEKQQTEKKHKKVKCGLCKARASRASEKIKPTRRTIPLMYEYEQVEAQCCSPTQLHARRHSLNFVAQATPVVRLQFGVLDPLLTPVLMQAADVILALLEVN